MEYKGQEKGPYYGVLQTCLILIIIPLIFILIIYGVFSYFKSLSEEAICYSTLTFGGTCGVLFHMIAIISGLFKGTFKVVINRISTFFQNVVLDIRLAFKIYFEDIKNEGIVFWIYLIIILSMIGLTIYGAVNLFDLYQEFFKK